MAQSHPQHQDLEAAIPTADQGTAARALIGGGSRPALFHGDREPGNTPWLTFLIERRIAFVVRWKEGNHPRPEDAPSLKAPPPSATQRRQEGRPAWKRTRTLLFRQKRRIGNPRTPRQPLLVTFGMVPVRLVEHDAPL
ncbi:MAG TPA: hypothetical protein VKX96_04955 [Chloroflexota bacterium]|nr:hypothetical protein [Chloroflexota bacterium]